MFLLELPPIEGRATCDNVMKLYADGELVASHDIWTTAVDVNLPGGTQVIGIECDDLGVIGAIRASFNQDIQTDSSWKCSATLEDGWNQPG